MANRAIPSETVKSKFQLQTDKEHIAGLLSKIEQELPGMQASAEILGQRHVRIIVAKPESPLFDNSPSAEPRVRDHTHGRGTPLE